MKPLKTSLLHETRKLSLLQTRQDLQPDDDESYEDFMDRCTDEIGDEDVCQIIWDERGAQGVHHKTHDGKVGALEFVLSDETPDRMGDVIMSDGWVLDNFLKNPIALFGHRSDFPIGTWKNVSVVDKSLRGFLELAPIGTSPRIDEIRALIDADILRAVSVGFRPLESKPRPESDWGYFFVKQELVETSLVSVPANPNALAVAKSLNISPQTMQVVFAGQGRKNMRLRRRGSTGGQAELRHRSNERAGKMSTLAQRIVELQTQLVDKQDALTAHLERVDDSNVSDADLEINNTLNAEIAQLRKTHAALIESEKVLAGGLGNGNLPAVRSRAENSTAYTSTVEAPMILRSRKKEFEPLEYFVRAAAVLYASKVWGTSPEATRQKVYGDDEATRMACDLVLRAASAPAITTVTGWAAELVQQIYTDPMPLLMPNAILTRLSAKGLALNFGRAGRIIIPTRSRTPTIAGSFVGEGQAIPVRQGAFTSQTLTPKKVAVITTWTKEMDEFSIPAIEGVLREALQVDTEVAVDTVLIDANAATAIRPPGLLNGIAALTATAGPGLAAVIGDLKLLIGALAVSTFGNIRVPVWLLNPEEVLSASLASAPNTGIFPFKDEITNNGTLNGIPIIDSSVVPLRTVILVDAADFVVAGAEGARLELSDQATLHMEDTTPLDLVATGTPPVVAAPQRSLFQTDSLALRLVMRMNWVQRRPGTIVWTQAVNW